MNVDFVENPIRNLPKPVQSAFDAIQSLETNRFFSVPVPVQLEESVALLSEGEHLLKEGQSEQGMKCVLSAIEKTQFSLSRRKHIASLCNRNLANPAKGRKLLGLD